MFLTILTFLSAISISVIAAGYSIIGLATLFAGAVIPIIAMGSALEVGKLVAASWLYNNWNSDVPRLLKGYLFGAIIVLIFITSLGIFGFLSKAHLDQVKPTSGNNIKIELLDKQINQQNLIIERAEKQISLLDKALEVYIDKEYVTRGLKERKKQEEERNTLNTAINEASDKIAELTNQKASLSLEQDKIEAEVGPIKYVAELIYGENAQDNFDKAVRFVILILIFVFDPLAVLLLIAANISLRQWRMKKQLTQSKKQEDIKGKLERQKKRLKRLGKKQRDYKKLMTTMGDFKDMSPDEIKVKLDQIYDWNDKK
jgi:predicted  nucleic acid-binding Zn-ribbon protein